MLPGVTGDDWLNTEDLFRLLRSELPLDAVMLRPARLWRTEEADETRTLYVLEARTDALPAGARWLDLEVLRAGALDYPEPGALETLLQEDADPRLVSALRPDWAKRGWLAEAEDWLARELSRLGRVPVGRPEQRKHWSLSAVLRQRTDAGEVYFKAVTAHFIAEPRITAAVAELFPDLTPQVLALEPKRGWLLLEPFRGAELSEGPLETQGETLRRFGALQLGSAMHRERFLGAGCADRGLHKLKEAVPGLLRESLELERLSPDERGRLLALEPFLLEKVDALAACGLPETLLHGDLHFGNVAAEEGDITIFDWTDACWGHPFFDAALQFHDRPAEDRAALLEAYLEPWLARYDEGAVRRALALAGTLSPLFYAESHEGIYRAQEPSSRWELSGVAADYLRRLLTPD